MYGFAILALAGLLVAKTVDVVRHATPQEMHRSMVLLLSALAGVAYAYMLDFSIFAAWGVDVRSALIGTIGTGLFTAAFAGVWHEVLGVMKEWAHRYHGEASEIEARLHRAA